MSSRDALVRSLRASRDVVGQGTRSKRLLPTFLICGAQRAGTTSMYRALAQHPNVITPVLRKGIHYFDLAPHRSIDWYQGHFPLASAARRIEARTGHRAITGESSPYYLWHPAAAQRISDALPHVRTIVMVRDPVERAYSAHAHEVARGFETESFERAIKLETTRLADSASRLAAGHRDLAHQHQAYLARSNYLPQLERLAAAIGRDQILVVDSADFFADPHPVWVDVCRFLDLPDADEVVFEQHNARSRAPLSTGLRDELDHQFQQTDDQLHSWLGREPSWRR